jgi:phage/plasmid-associated DNA primase
VVPDLPSEPLPSAVKAIISGEGQTARSPGERAFPLTPRAGELFGCNHPLPPAKDTSDGFRRRWVIITHNRQFTGDPQRDPLIAEKLIDEERPQVVRWALEGAVRLLRRRDYTLPDSHFVALDRWMRRDDPVRIFVERRLEIGGGHWTRSSTLHDAMIAWLRAIKQAGDVSIQAFGRRLSELRVPAKGSNAGTLYDARLRP